MMAIETLNRREWKTHAHADIPGCPTAALAVRIVVTVAIHITDANSSKYVVRLALP
jgi:hypothetical protein